MVGFFTARSMIWSMWEHLETKPLVKRSLHFFFFLNHIVQKVSQHVWIFSCWFTLKIQNLNCTLISFCVCIHINTVSSFRAESPCQCVCIDLNLRREMKDVKDKQRDNRNNPWIYSANSPKNKQTPTVQLQSQTNNLTSTSLIPSVININAF